jgi:hypothetical protein
MDNLVDQKLLVPGTRILFRWVDDETKKEHILDGEIKGASPVMVGYSVEDENYSYDVPHQDIVRIREGLPRLSP